MNGPLTMYRTKQVVRHDIAVPLPDCMYQLKNIHGTRNGVLEQRAHHVSSSAQKPDIFDQVKQFLKNNKNIPEMAELELRQEEILKQLADLKKQMNAIRNNLKISQTASVITIRSRQPPSIPDIIINANPTNPPYSLEVLQKLWKDYVFLSVKTFVHSSVTDLRQNAKQLTASLENFKAGKGPQVNVKLIWKDVGADPELLISHRPILGEVNILRYLSRLSTDILNYETYNNVHEVDSLLDTCYNIVKAKNKTERASLLQALNKSLGKSDWLAGRSQISIADLAAFSAIKQVTSSSEINVGLGKWMQRCAAV